MKQLKIEVKHSHTWQWSIILGLAKLRLEKFAQKLFNDSPIMRVTINGEKQAPIKLIDLVNRAHKT